MAIDEKLPKEDESLITKDTNPETFINEDLWKKVLFKTVGYLIYAFAMAIVTDGMLGFNVNKFFVGIQVMVLPIVWSAMDLQARNKEIQKNLENEKRLEEKLMNNNKKLLAMVNYFKEENCRRIFISEYFGFHDEKPCGNCDCCDKLILSAT